MLRGGHGGGETGSLDLIGKNGAGDGSTVVLEVCGLVSLLLLLISPFSAKQRAKA